MSTTDLSAAIDEVLYPAEAIQAKVAELGAALTDAYSGRRPLLVGILCGCFPFMADLVRSVGTHLEVDFMSVSSYGSGTESSGVVRLIKDLNEPIVGRHVVLVEDIIDTGLTLSYLVDNLRTRQPASIEICTLLDKADARKKDVNVKFRGFACPNRFVVGYGLDYAGLFRNLPYIGVLKREVYGGA
jgi:hypoxanthine phosphoribosyltransferase